MLLLAFGGAMVAGNVAAMVRKRASPLAGGDVTRAPWRRTIPFTLIGLVVGIWGLATLVT